METAASSPSRIRRLIDWMPPRWVLLVLFCAVLVVRGRFMLANSEAFSPDPDAYGLVASRIYQYSTFGLYFDNRLDSSMNVRPTAARPPLYPVVLSMTYVFDLETLAALGALHVVLGAFTVWGVWHLGRLWKLPPGACLIAAALVTVDPILLAHSVMRMTETLAAFLAVMTLISVTRFAQDNSFGWALLSGLLMGLCVLCRPEFLVWSLSVAAVFPFAAEGAHRLRRLTICIALAAVVLAPWAIRNARLFGYPVVTTTHGGITLLLANNPGFYEYLRSAPWGTTWDGSEVNEQHWHLQSSQLLRQLTPPGRPPVRLLYVDEVAVDRETYRQAFENIRNEPAMFAYSCLVRVGRLWAVLPHQTSVNESPSRRGLRYSVAIWYTVELALAALGLWTLGRKLLASPWLWGTLLVGSFTLVHAFYWTDMRMRAPLAAVVALLAAVGVARLLAKRQAVTSLTS